MTAGGKLLGAAIEWLPFWQVVGPELMEAAKVLHRKFAHNPNAAIVAIREIKDHWNNTDADDAGFKARIQAVANEEAEARSEPTDQPVPAPESDLIVAPDKEAPER